jgi:hypothetical protein
MRLLALFTVSILLSACGQEEIKVDKEARAAESRATVKEFFGQLKGELQAAMKSGGPVQAIEVCKTKAPMIANDISTKKGWRVARTSLKTRNPDNAPDAWERQVLNKFEEQKAQGSDPKKLEHFEVVEVNGKQSFRYMKAIPAGDICMTCHGVELNPAVSQKIAQLYPNDMATGYKPGDIRGAFTVTQTIQ